LTFGANLRHLTNTGHHVDAQLKLSQVLSGLALQYVIPGQNPLTDQYTIGANTQKFSPKNGNSISKSLSFGYVKTVGDWKWMPTITYLREHYNIVGNPSHNSRILYPSFELSRINADDLINTRFGTKIDFLVRGASRHVVSNVSFAQAEIKGKIIYSPTELSRVIARGDFGYTTVKDLNTLPISLQFYAGGLDSVRGFPYSYFGPGRYLKVASLELQHRLYGKISGAVFYDIGTADNHLNAPMGRGTGIGLIYESAIGPIKAYVGYGRLAQKPRHFAFEFSLGPDL
jgi:translocation and assembly module TamA